MNSLPHLSRRELFQRALLASLAAAIGGRVMPCAAAGPRDDESLTSRVSDAAIARRKQRVLRAIAADPGFNPKKPNPRYQYAVAGSRLALDPADAAILDYVQRVAGYDDHFGYQGLAVLYARFGQGWGPELLAAVRASVTDWNGFLGGGTENIVAMRRGSGLIFGESFPDEIFHHGLTGRQLAAECKDYLSRFGRAVFAGSMSEYLSPIYLPVSSGPFVNVAEHSRDDEARLMAEALRDWMFADLALNTFECSAVAPFQRDKGLLHDTYQQSIPAGITQWVSWIYFGGGNIAEGDGPFTEGTQPYHPPAAFHALSAWAPHPIIRHLAVKRVALPYSVRQARSAFLHVYPAMVSPYGKKTTLEAKPDKAGKKDKAVKNDKFAAALAATETPNEDLRRELRSVYFDEDYAIGAGYFRTTPEDPGTRTIVPFGVWWRSASRNNFLLIAHPFWFAELPGDEGEPPLGDDDWLGVSPFCRSVHHENAAILLYDLPATDPYVDVPVGGSEKIRVLRSGKVIQSVYAYVPETVHEITESGGIFFVREGDFYLALRPLSAGAQWTTTTHAGYRRIEAPGPLTGFVVEVGSTREHGTFAAFQAKISAAQLDTSRLATDKAVSYTSSRGHRLSVAHVPGTWLPAASVNGTALDFDRWPISASPYLTCADRVLEVNDGREGFQIGWRGPHPIYTYYTLHGGQRTDTRRRFLREGRLVTESL